MFVEEEMEEANDVGIGEQQPIHWETSIIRNLQVPHQLASNSIQSPTAFTCFLVPFALGN